VCVREGEGGCVCECEWSDIYKSMNIPSERSHSLFGDSLVLVSIDHSSPLSLEISNPSFLHERGQRSRSEHTAASESHGLQCVSIHLVLCGSHIIKLEATR